jgi:sensor histidine kinase YesM
MARYSSNVIFVKMKESVGYSVSQLSQNVEDLLKSYEQIADFFYTNNTLQDRLLTKYQSLPEALQVYTDYVNPLFTSIHSSRSNDILKMNIYSENRTFQFGGIKLLDEDMSPVKRYLNHRLGNGEKSPKIWSIEGEAATISTGILRLTQRLNNQMTNANLYFTLDVDVKLLNNLFVKENSEHRYILILPNGDVIVDSYKAGSYNLKSADYEFHSLVSRHESGNSIIQDNGQSYLLTYNTLNSRSSIKGIKVVSLHPLNELLVQANELRKIAILLLATALFVSIVINYGLAIGLTRRLSELAGIMRKMEMDNLQPITQIRGKDEISQLGHVFNGLILRVQRLISDVYASELNQKRLELQTKESELYALQTQINPHYLFNTLNAIRGSLLKNGDRKNAEIVSLLARSFRNILGKGGIMIKLSEELEIVETYLKIQQFRFTDRLAFEIEIPKPLHQFSVPKLSVQTLVENAIVHGLESSDKKTTIAIRAQIPDNESFCIIVEDNGPGIAPERLSEIRERLDNRLETTDSKQIGLRNVHQRLQHSFGKEFGLYLESELDNGTRIIMYLPIK